MYEFFIYLLVMSVVTYLTRLLPMLFIRKKIENCFLRSFLHYVPYTVLTVMLIPGVFFITGSPISALVGLLTASVISLCNRGLIVTAAGASVAVLITELLLTIL